MFLTHNENITSNIINCGYWEHQQPTIHGYIYIYTVWVEWSYCPRNSQMFTHTQLMDSCLGFEFEAWKMWKHCCNSQQRHTSREYLTRWIYILPQKGRKPTNQTPILPQEVLGFIGQEAVDTLCARVWSLLSKLSNQMIMIHVEFSICWTFWTLCNLSTSDTEMFNLKCPAATGYTLLWWDHHQHCHQRKSESHWETWATHGCRSLLWPRIQPYLLRKYDWGMTWGVKSLVSKYLYPHEHDICNLGPRCCNHFECHHISSLSWFKHDKNKNSHLMPW